MERIAKLRKEKDITQTALAMKLNVTQNMISFYEKGKNQPSIETLINLSKIFNVSVDYLIENTNIRNKPEDLVTNLSPTEIEMLNLFKALPHDKQQRVIGIIQAIEHME